MKRIERWARADDAPIDYQRLKSRLAFLAERLYHDYEPTLARGPQFVDRLTSWLDGAAEEDDQRLMFELAGEIYFVGSMEMEQLYQDVLHGPIAWWLMEKAAVFDLSVDLDARVEEAMGGTWFCPLTDSMQIARFHHINNIAGKNLRPDWHTLARLGDPARIAAYMEKEKLGRLVLLEDFVGSGSQASSAVKFIAEHLPEVPVLFAPLLIAPQGVKAVGELLDELGGSIDFRPMLVLPQACILADSPLPDESERHPRFRDLLENVDGLVRAPARTDPKESQYGFGTVGALSVLFTNCPNNVLPLIHHTSDHWSPLFPRSVRK